MDRNELLEAPVENGCIVIPSGVTLAWGPQDSLFVHLCISSQEKCKNHLNVHDLTFVTEKELQLDDEKAMHFSFASYASSVFSTIRRVVDIEESSFLHSIANYSELYMEFVSNSHSGEEFFLSYDMRYLLKTNKKSEIRFFLSILGDYLQHFVSYPHTLLVKYVGCYSVKMPGKRRKFFLAMQNIFFPPDRIKDRFDVKGCLAGRYQKPDPPGSNAINVLKDQNFINEKLEIGAEAEWLVQQITVDSVFLRDLCVMDYSLLIGRQTLHQSELSQTKSEVVTKIWRSLSPVKRVNHPEANGMNNMQLSETKTDEKTGTSPLDELDNLPGLITIQPSSQTTTHIKGGMTFPSSLAHSIERFNSEHRRLLPNSPNALHIIDGLQFRYYLGIIDFLTQWSYMQKAARVWKMIKYCSRDHSTLPPDVYSHRFITFITEHIA
ncbi:hypothetical protein C0Q70_18225 [Pomacea canaliculata]|uniref:PIPK domain-containing protein n=1 Tax=Pomacea canaliculata TaxID=400727 RepID=A0A2T7NMM4_POMCA|nr:hypothetical protein C0Q70_18225 [Pomacea canaliculata]